MVKDYIIIAKTQLENIFLRYEKSEQKWLLRIISFSLSVSASLLLSISTTDKYGSVWIVSAGVCEATIKALFIISLLTLIISVIYWGYLWKNNKFKTLETLQNDISKENLYKEDFTYILLVPKYEKGQLLYPVKQKDSWENSLFFPYIKHNYGHDSISMHEQEIITDIQNSYDIRIPIQIEEVTPEENKVTKIKGDLPRDFYFRFLYISSVSPFFKKYLTDLFEEKGFSYMSIDKIGENSITRINNGRVLNIIENNTTIIKKIYTEKNKNKTKIIWNIDKSCSNRCAICAYGDKLTNGLNVDDMKGIVDSILSVDVDHIDLSMGDNAIIENIENVIKYIRQKSKIEISLTATAKLFSNFDYAFLNENVNEIEITYDFPHTLSVSHHIRPQSYNLDNFNIAKDLLRKKPKFRVSINIVLHKDVTKDNLKTILKNLSKINVSSCNLLRLMPLGNASIESYPNVLFDTDFYKEIPNIIRTKKTHLHCALNCLLQENSGCRMGVGKLGISPQGEVYVCAWAEHLPTILGNPFYIGKIDGYDKLRDVLIDSNAYQNIIKHKKGKDCKIFSFLHKSDIWSQSDKLYEKTKKSI